MPRRWNRHDNQLAPRRAKTPKERLHERRLGKKGLVAKWLDVRLTLGILA